MALRDLLHDFSFRRFWMAYSLGIFGVNFFFISLTWLVLETSGSGSALGVILMINALPRAALMLLGGTVTDRYAPTVVLRTAITLQAALLAGMVVLLASGQLQLWQLGVMAGLLGIADAFSMPAALSAVPRMVPREHLAAANGLVQGSEMIAQISSPFLAGFVIAQAGLDWAAGINSLLFAGAALLLLGMLRRKMATADTSPGQKQSVWRDTLDGLRYVWSQSAIRTMLIMIAALNLAAIGPIIVGGAALVQVRLNGSADMYGLFMAAFGLGTPVGLGLAVLLANRGRPDRIVMLVGGVIGAGLALFGVAGSLPVMVLLAAVIGMAAGYFNMVANVYIQTNTAVHMHGRVMSVVMFTAVAFDPVSQAYAGFMVDLSLTALFLISGLAMVVVSLLGAWMQRRALHD